MSKKILVLTDFDSRLKWACSLAGAMFSEEFVIVATREQNVSKFSRYISPNFVFQVYDELADVYTQFNFQTFDIIVVALGGAAHIKVFNEINRQRTDRRPVIITGFNGLVDPSDPHGLLCRYGADIICVNSAKDMELFRSYLSSLNKSHESLVLTGLARSYINIAASQSESSISKILFVEQAGLPTHKAQVNFLASKLIEYCKKYSSRKLYVKLRDVTHKDHMSNKEVVYDLNSALAENVNSLPSNLIFTSDLIEDLIISSDLIVSFTSTAIIEALLLGKKVVALSDFGISKAIGNHVFLGSNILGSTNNLLEDEIPSVDIKWMNDNCKLFDAKPLQDAICTTVKSKSNIQDLNLFYGKETHPFFHRTYLKSKPQSIIKRIVRKLS